jgi:hypothetical protein
MKAHRDTRLLAKKMYKMDHLPGEMSVTGPVFNNEIQKVARSKKIGDSLK